MRFRVFGFLVPPLFLLSTVPDAFGLARRCGTETTDRDHRAPGGLAGRFIASRCRRELAIIGGGGRLRFGTSILAVARKRFDPSTET